MIRILFLAIVLGPIMALAQPKLSDDKATKKAQNLYQNLHQLSGKGILFGHEDDLAYGVTWWNEPGRSDVKEAVGSFPAVYGWDIGKIGQKNNIDSVSFKNMKKWMIQSYKRGGVNAVSWHLDNLTSGGNSWERTATIKNILPGGKNHHAYLDKLDGVARYFKSLRSGWTSIPIIFRPFHEQNGNWFWWGKGSCSEQEYIELWRFTVHYLRNLKKVHQLIFAYSPDASRLDTEDVEASYFYGYPGDEWVDIIGLDDYWNVGRPENARPLEDQKQIFTANLEMISQIAEDKGKIAALTETGQFGILNPNWYSEHILCPISNSEKITISYLLVWRNAAPDNCFVPYMGHHALDDFKKFRASDKTLFENDLHGIYK